MQVDEQRGDPDVVKALGVGESPSRRGLIWAGVGVVFLALLGAGIARHYKQRALANKPTFQSVAVARADIQVIINATGTLKGLNTVEVGAEVSGRVTRVLVDFNDPVKR